MKIFAATLCPLLLAVPLLAQHDAQRNAVQALAREDWKGFEKQLRNPRIDAGMEETRLVNLLRLVGKGEVDAAIALARESLEAGLDPARLVAGADPHLLELRAHEDFASLPGIAEVGPLVHGPMLGNVTDTTASIWVRTNGPRRVLWSAVASDSDAKILSEEKTTSAGSDFTAVLSLSGLEPGMEYVTAILFGEGESEEDRYAGPVVVTRPEQGSPAKFSVAFGGGAGFVPEFHRMWDTIQGFHPDALLMLGDNVYIDDPEHVVTQHYCYYRRHSEPGWRHLVGQVPVYAIYDDHDFGDNDCIPGKEIEKPAWKRPVLEVFRQNWVNPGYGGGEENPGCWYDFHIGDVHFVMLDGRYYRDRAAKSMLGPVQKAWLFETLKQSEATFKVLASAVPFTQAIKPGSMDPWDGYPQEREEIFAFLEREKIGGVFLIAADRHRTDLRTTERENGYTLYEFMSSRLTNRHTHSVVKTPGLVWGYNKTCSFGLMEFDTTAGDPRVKFRCIDIDGEERESFVLKRSMLKAE